MGHYTVTDAIILTRHGVEQVLLGALAFPPGKLDEASASRLLHDALLTYEWCVREDMARNIRKAIEVTGPVSAEVADNLIKIAELERVNSSLALSKLATFIAQAYFAPVVSPTLN